MLTRTLMIVLTDDRLDCAATISAAPVPSIDAWQRTLGLAIAKAPALRHAFSARLSFLPKR
jgi:hypothetical protein